MKTESKSHHQPITRLMQMVSVGMLMIAAAPLLVAESGGGGKSVEDFAERLREDLKSNQGAFRDLVSRAMENGGKLKLDPEELGKLMGENEAAEGESDAMRSGMKEFLKGLLGEDGKSRVLSPEEAEQLRGEWMKRVRGKSDRDGEKDSKSEPLKSFLEMFQHQMKSRKVGENEREHGSILEEYRSIVGPARQSTVSLAIGRNQVALGTVVDPTGYIVTKASEVGGDGLRCIFPGGVRVTAEVLDIYVPLDLALVKVGADGLEAVEWADEEKIDLGTFLAAPGIGEDPIAIGVASVAPRNLSEKTRGFLGVTPAGSGDGVVLERVIPDMPAAKAGLEKGDLVLAVDGVEVRSRAEFHHMIGGRSPGEKLEFKVRRGEDEKTLTAQLVSRAALIELNGGSARTNPRIERMNLMGGDLSDTRAGFTSALQTDLTLEPSECGGPVVNLDGKVVGVNIARGGRVKSYAVPANTLRALLGNVRSGRFTITDLGELREAADLAGEGLKRAEAALQLARETKAAADAALEQASDK